MQANPSIRLSVFFDHVVEYARQADLPIGRALADVRAWGYTAVDPGYVHYRDCDPAALGRTVADAGLVPACVHYNFGFERGIDPSVIARFVERTQEIGITRVMAVPGLYNPAAERESARAEMLRGLTLLCRAAWDAGLTVSVEDYDDTRSPTATSADMLWFGTQLPGLKFTFDTGNFFYSDEKELAVLPLLADRVDHVHVKDRSLAPLTAGEKGRETPSGRVMYPAPIGAGIIPIAKIVAGLRSRGYGGYFTVEHFGAVNMGDYLRRSAAFLAPLLA